MAKEELFKNRLSAFFVRQFGAFPVYRGNTNRAALHQANQVLDQGKALGMFPEGKRSTSNALTAALDGTAMIAYHTHARILPVGITGSERVRGFTWLLHRPGVTINIGQPFTLPKTDQALSREQLREYTAIIMNRVAELLPERYRGEYAGNGVPWQIK